MGLGNEQAKKFLFTLQGIGAVFTGIFLAAYLAGLPSTNVLHSEPAFRIPLAVLGIALMALVLLAIVFAALSEKT